MKQKIIGSYECGFDVIQLVGREGSGGEFYSIPGDINYPRIKVGLDQESFSLLLEALLHEVYEYELHKCGLRTRRTDSISCDHANYMFVFDHRQFAEVTARCAEFLEKALPDTRKAWKKWNKNK